MTKNRYDRSRMMKAAHSEWRATKHRPGMTFGKCLALAWAVEKKRCAGRQYYQPDPARIPLPIIAAQIGRTRDIIRL
jgi:hypothetical protein